MSESSKTTTDHDTIRSWAQARDARPAHVKGTEEAGGVGVLRLDFPAYEGPPLEHITWDQFFGKFDEQKLAMVYQDETADGKPSNFNKLVSRDSSD